MRRLLYETKKRAQAAGILPANESIHSGDLGQRAHSDMMLPPPWMDTYNPQMPQPYGQVPIHPGYMYYPRDTAKSIENIRPRIALPPPYNQVPQVVPAKGHIPCTPCMQVHQQLASMHPEEWRVFQQIGAPRGFAKGVKVVLFDFDGTLSVNAQISPEDYYNPTVQSVVMNLGGPERLEALRKMFITLKNQGIDIYILSLSWKCVLSVHLLMTDLQSLIPYDHIIAQDNDRFRDQCQASKASFISGFMKEHRLSYDQVLFVDDCSSHITATRSVCKTLQVPSSTAGLSLSDFAYILQLCGINGIDHGYFNMVGGAQQHRPPYRENIR